MTEENCLKLYEIANKYDAKFVLNTENGRYVNKNEIDEETNIFKNVFKESINRINNLELSDDNITKLINELSFSLATLAEYSNAL